MRRRETGGGDVLAGTIIVGVVLLLVGAEVGLRRLSAPSGSVVVGNQGEYPIEGLVVTSGGSRASVARIAPGEVARIWLDGRGKHPLRLTFRQRGNAVTSFEVPEFDPAMLHNDGNRLVLNVRPNELERYQEEDDPSMLRRGAESLWDWIQRWFDSP